MSEMKHNIPAHLLPSGEDQVIAEDEAEIELNRKVETERWVHTKEPDDGECPYCGNEYKRVSWASTHSAKGVPYYDTEATDFIVEFVHKDRYDRNGQLTSSQYFCGPHHADTPATTGDRDWQLEAVRNV